ncbi:MAG: pyridoxal 5'-phosphate synthase glutaminase subunit PdxT [Clostridia bacterium]|jgi:5'-phosphate synthase pdxT subunit
MLVAVLAVQGSFAEHEMVLKKSGISYVELRQKKDLSLSFDGLILPGGESTVQAKLLCDLDMYDTLKDMIQNGLPTLATCAGLILLADRISNDTVGHFKTMPITVKRNAYGRQLGSFYTEGDFKGIGKVPMTFIRAPYIESVQDGVEILSKVDGNIVAVRYENQIGLSFHPELNDDMGIYDMFLDIVRNHSALVKKAGTLRA